MESRDKWVPAYFACPPPYFACPPDLWVPISPFKHEKTQQDADSGKKRQSELLELIQNKIASLSKQAEKSIRDVWRFTHPLTAAWNKINPLRNNPVVQHWGVMVSETDHETVETAMKYRKELKKNKKGWGMGVIHELARMGKQSAYRVSKWMSNMIRKGFKLMRVGQTDLKNEQILSKGYEIIDENPEYELGSADCQSFTMKLLKAICCSTEGDLSVEEMMEKEKLKFTR